MNQHREKIILRGGEPHSLMDLATKRLSEMLIQLNKNEIGPNFLWLKSDCNPFRCLVPRNLEELLQLLRYTPDRFVKKEIIQLLFCRKMKTVNLYGLNFRPDNFANILEVIKASDSDITTFIFKTIEEQWLSDLPQVMVGNHCELNFNSLCSFVSKMTSLTRLSVNAICNDFLLGIIGESCPNLVILEAISKKITSNGLKKLCLSSDQTRRCQKLEVIHLYNVLDQPILNEGIRILLQTLPRLRAIRNADNVLCQILIDVLNEHPVSTFALEELYFVGTCFNKTHSSLIVESCPLLTKLEVDVPTVDQLLKFGELTRLKELSISFVQFEDEFENGIVPLLRRIGERLEVLKLEDTPQIDFTVIDKYCPHLKRLDCDLDEPYIKISFPDATMFVELETLSVNFSADLKPEECIEFTSKFTNVRYLKLLCDDGNYDMTYLKSMFLQMSWPKIETIDIQLLSSSSGILESDYCFDIE